MLLSDQQKYIISVLKQVKYIYACASYIRSPSSITGRSAL